MNQDNVNLTIDTTLKIDDLALIKHLENSEFLPNIKTVYNKIQPLLNNRIPKIFGSYTLHNIDHSIRIMEYMADIIQDITALSELEITLLIYSALLHDIGMAVSENDITLIKNDDFKSIDIKFSSMKKVMDNDEDLALTEYIRRFHSSLSAKYIRENLNEFFQIPGQITAYFTEDLALICESHTKDFDWISANLTQNDKKGHFHYNAQFIACILRLGDILDIDSSRTPYTLYKSVNPKGISENEWKQHFVITNTKKIEFDSVKKQKQLVFHGESSTANIHRKILLYIDWVEKELIGSMELVNIMPNQYNLLFDSSPKIHIKPIGFTFSEYKMSLDYHAISQLLMGEKIYGSKSLGLREIIQNSLDASRVRQEIEKQNYQFGDDNYEPKIKIILDSKNNTVTIRDYGMGMSMEIIKKHFLNIGVSYYNSTDFKLRDLNYKPIGNYGIGFLSCFMLSDNVKVVTRDYKGKSKFTVELEKYNEYTSLTQIDDFNFEGTEVILNYANFMSVFGNNVAEIKKFLDTYFLTDGITLQLILKEEEITHDIINLLEIAEPNNFIKINLSDYLNDIEGYVIIKNNKDYVTNIENLDFKGDIYTYDDINGIQKVDEHSTIDLDEYIIDNEIKYISIPLVEEDLEERFLNGITFTNSAIEDVIEKLETDLRWISIIVKKDLQEEIYQCTFDDEDSGIFENLKLKELYKLGHSTKCTTAIFEETINIYEGEKNKLYLTFDKAERYFYYRGNYDKKRKELFVRSVLIKEFKLNLPYTASLFEIESLVVNLTSRIFVPEISRNSFDDLTNEEINYILGKAIHCSVLEKFTLSNEKKQTLQSFIEHYYARITEFEK
ncbi:Chaperone protein HtpG [Mariniflexile rhizosphaerae]|uniref:HD domain-containing protein n=1 Tax=unclassified Mariniflexile TaxID=2643887 RepID=UPI000E32E96A|nr:HD domain-containing protein [Mariniflexile sp. TRM1-10]AXP79765.1 Chaperone protein HtpG [Mariniflexile sp. TRM1-10]